MSRNKKQSTETVTSSLPFYDGREAIIEMASLIYVARAAFSRETNESELKKIKEESYKQAEVYFSL